MDQARILHLTGITVALGHNAREVFAQFLQRAQEKHIPLSFDVNYRAKLWSTREAATSMAALKRCIADDIAIITLEEVRALLQRGTTRFR